MSLPTRPLPRYAGVDLLAIVVLTAIAISGSGLESLLLRRLPPE